MRFRTSFEIKKCYIRQMALNWQLAVQIQSSVSNPNLARLANTTKVILTRLFKHRIEEAQRLNVSEENILSIYRDFILSHRMHLHFPHRACIDSNKQTPLFTTSETFVWVAHPHLKFFWKLALLSADQVCLFWKISATPSAKFWNGCLDGRVVRRAGEHVGLQWA